MVRRPEFRWQPASVQAFRPVASSYSFRSANFALDFFITAAEAKGVGKLLSKPRIVTQNNEKAVIKQGVKLPIQTTINNTISVQFIDAVLQLEVTPQITIEGTIFMDVLVENTQIDQGIPRVQGIPALDTQSAQTKVLVPDGGTVVIGGIIVNTQNTNIQADSHRRQLAADRKPVQTDNHLHPVAGVAVLPDAQNHTWVIWDGEITGPDGSADLAIALV